MFLESGGIYTDSPEKLATRDSFNDYQEYATKILPQDQRVEAQQAVERRIQQKLKLTLYRRWSRRHQK